MFYLIKFLHPLSLSDFNTNKTIEKVLYLAPTFSLSCTTNLQTKSVQKPEKNVLGKKMSLLSKWLGNISNGVHTHFH